MLKIEELNSFFNQYTNSNLEKVKNKTFILEDLRNKEDKLKVYSLALSDFNKQQNKSGLEHFKFLLDRTVSFLSNFDPNDIDKNTAIVNEFISLLESKEQEFSLIVTNLTTVRLSWDSFTSSNKEFSESKIQKDIQLNFDSINERLREMNMDSLGEVESALSKAKENLNLVKSKVENTKHSLDQYIFIGEYALEIKKEAEDLIKNKEDLSIHVFVERSDILLNKIEDIKNNKSTLAIGPVKVIKAKNKEDYSIYKYTIQIGDFVLKNDTFFNDEESLILEETGEHLYLENIPIDGIFSGRDIVENIDYYDVFLKSIQELDNAANKTFLVISSITFFVGLLSFFIGGIMGPSIFGGVIVGITIFFNFYLKSIKKHYEIKTKMKDIFVFSKIDYVISSLGDTIDLDFIINGIIINFDDTIGNSKYIEWGSDKWLKEYQ